MCLFSVEPNEDSVMIVDSGSSDDGGGGEVYNKDVLEMRKAFKKPFSKKY